MRFTENRTKGGVHVMVFCWLWDEGVGETLDSIALREGNTLRLLHHGRISARDMGFLENGYIFVPFICVAFPNTSSPIMGRGGRGFLVS